MSFIDKILNKITMYRLALYYLLFLVGAGILVAFLGHVPYSPYAILFSAAFITVVCLVVNAVFTKIFKAPANPESVYITALILTLIIAPIHSTTDGHFFAFAIWASVWAMASKYILAVSKKHIFNPAAIAVVITAFTLGFSANWWVGTVWMLPFVLVGGLLVVRKLQRFKMVGSFATAALVVILIFHPAVVTIWKALVETPLVFFACIMLTEPLTAPTTRKMRIAYGLLVGCLFAPFVHVGSVYSTPELALIVGNIFAFMVVSPKKKLILKLRERQEVAAGTFDFWFDIQGSGAAPAGGTAAPLRFRAGQYLEWTLESRLVSKKAMSENPTGNPVRLYVADLWKIMLNIFSADSRGVRRYFTIASAPTEEGIAIGVKFYGQFGSAGDASAAGTSSSFKKALMAMRPGDTILASGLAGDFVLPPSGSQQRIVMMAGGIGITPFRSMIREMIDRDEQRPVRLIYSNKTAADIAYKDIFDEAHKRLGMKTVYTLTEPSGIPAGWRGRRGFVDAKMIEEEVPGYINCLFYLSGPRAMVVAYENILFEMGVPASQIRKDFFPGFV